MNNLFQSKCQKSSCLKNNPDVSGYNTNWNLLYMEISVTHKKKEESKCKIQQS